jgi:hypothetical protein
VVPRPCEAKDGKGQSELSMPFVRASKIDDPTSRDIMFALLVAGTARGILASARQDQIKDAYVAIGSRRGTDEASPASAEDDAPRLANTVLAVEGISLRALKSVDFALKLFTVHPI